MDPTTGSSPAVPGGGPDVPKTEPGLSEVGPPTEPKTETTSNSNQTSPNPNLNPNPSPNPNLNPSPNPNQSLNPSPNHPNQNLNPPNPNPNPSPNASSNPSPNPNPNPVNNANANAANNSLSQEDILSFLRSHGLKDTEHLFKNELAKIKTESSSSSGSGSGQQPKSSSGLLPVKQEAKEDGSSSRNDVNQATNVLSSYSSEGDPHMYSQV